MHMNMVTICKRVEVGNRSILCKMNLKCYLVWMALILIQVKQQTWQARHTSLTCLQGLSFKFKCACVVWRLFVFTNHNPTIVWQKFLFGYFAKVVVALQCWAWKDKIGPTFVKIYPWYLWSCCTHWNQKGEQIVINIHCFHI
jgi:hypothetical protein